MSADLNNAFRLAPKDLQPGDYLLAVRHSGPPQIYRANPAEQQRHAVNAGSGSIPTSGAVLLTRTSAASNLTLPSPGDTDEVLRIVDISGKEHTVATASPNKINGNMNTIRFSGNKGAAITLEGYNGVWYATHLNDVEIYND
jgi:hypothetical protein